MCLLIICMLLLSIFNIQSADNAALRSLHIAEYKLNYKLDYQKALLCFQDTITTCKESTTNQQMQEIQAQAITGLAMCLHHLGKNSMRDQQMESARQLIGLPEKLLDYKPKTYINSLLLNFLLLTAIDGACALKMLANAINLLSNKKLVYIALKNRLTKL